MDEYRNLVHTARHHLQLELSSGTGPFTQGRRIAIRQGRAQYSNGTRALGSLQGARQATGTFHSVSQRCNGWISSPSFNHRIKVLPNKKMALIVTWNDTTGTGTHKNMLEQLTQQMKRQAAAYTDHLNEVSAAQQKELTRRHQSQLELEADQHQLARNQDLAKLTGMTKGIQERTRQSRQGSCSSASSRTVARSSIFDRRRMAENGRNSDVNHEFNQSMNSSTRCSKGNVNWFRQLWHSKRSIRLHRIIFRMASEYAVGLLLSMANC